jgi:hypothetical protein
LRLRSAGESIVLVTANATLVPDLANPVPQASPATERARVGRRRPRSPNPDRHRPTAVIAGSAREPPPVARLFRLRSAGKSIASITANATLVPGLANPVPQASPATERVRIGRRRPRSPNPDRHRPAAVIAGSAREPPPAAGLFRPRSPPAAKLFRLRPPPAVASRASWPTGTSPPAFGRPPRIEAPATETARPRDPRASADHSGLISPGHDAPYDPVDSGPPIRHGARSPRVAWTRRRHNEDTVEKG